MDHDETHPESQQSELSDSIDALLGEIDATCAAYEDQPTDSTQDEPAAQSPTDEPDAQADIGNKALDALDAVSENADALLDEAIGDLLDDADSAIENITEQPTDTTPDDLDTDDPLAGIADDLLDDDELMSEVLESTTGEEVIDEDFLADISTDTPSIQDAGESDSELESEEAALDAELDVDAETTIEPEDSEPEVASEPDSEPEDITEEDIAEAETAEASIDETEETQTPDSAVDDVESIESMLEEINDDLVGDIQTQPPQEELGTEDSTAPDLDPDLDLDLNLDEEPVPQDDDQPEAEAVDPLIEEEPAAESESQQVDDDPTSTLGDLDDALASVGDELLMGDFETPDGELIDSSAMEDSIDPALLLDQLDLDQIESPKEISATDTSEESQTEPISEPEPAEVEAEAEAQSESPSTDPVPSQPATEQAPAAKPSQSPDKAHAFVSNDDDEIYSIWQKAAITIQSAAKQSAEIAITKGGPLVAKGFLQLSRPLASQSPQVRNSVGFIALWTMFLAIVLWSYTMFFRVTPTPTPSQAPTRVVSSDDNLERIENQMPAQEP